MTFENIRYVGVNDRDIDLFEGMYVVPEGVSYNSYVIIDEKSAVTDGVDGGFADVWLKNIAAVLGDKKPAYLIINHMEPDHSASIFAFAEKYPDATLVGNDKTFVMLSEYFGTAFEGRRLVVTDGEELSLGKTKLKFVFAPMVHWPEVMVTYDETDKVLFSADAFGKFGTLDVEDKWDSEARRYYFGIVGKYGLQVQGLLKKLSAYEIRAIFPLHGPVLRENLGYYIEKYNLWSSYTPEVDGVLIAYTSVYGHTKAAAEKLYEELKDRNVTVSICDLARSDWSQCVASAFQLSKLALATTTYNGEIFPAMREFIDCLVERNYKNRKIGIIENGTWAPVAAKLIRAKFEKCKNITFAETDVKIRSALNDESLAALKVLADEMSK